MASEQRDMSPDHAEVTMSRGPKHTTWISPAAIPRNCRAAMQQPLSIPTTYPINWEDRWSPEPIRAIRGLKRSEMVVTAAVAAVRITVHVDIHMERRLVAAG